MAQKVHVVLVDDIDGSDATETVHFGLDGKEYKIDLNDKHAGELRDALALYVGHAEKVSSRGTRRSATRSSSTAGNPGAVREWAKSRGMDVSERGRISQEVQAAYDAAH